MGTFRLRAATIAPVSLLLIALVVAVLAVGSSNNSPGGRDEFRGGGRAVALVSAGFVSASTFLCNGALNDDQTIVFTAAHCLESTTHLGIGGSSICSSDGWRIVPIDEYVVAVEDDLAVLAASAGSPQSRLTVQPPVDGDVVTVVGFGPDAQHRSSVCDRRATEVQVDEQHCVSHTAPTRRLCLTDPDRTICPGWSGAGLYDRDWRLVAVVSSGSRCQAARDHYVIAEPIGGR